MDLDRMHVFFMEVFIYLSRHLFSLVVIICVCNVCVRVFEYVCACDYLSFTSNVVAKQIKEYLLKVGGTNEINIQYLPLQLQH